MEQNEVDMKSTIKNLYIVAKRSFKGRYITPDKKEADDLLEPGTTIDCYENGIHTSSYGCVLASEVEPKNKKIRKTPADECIIDARKEALSNVTLANRVDSSYTIDKDFNSGKFVIKNK